MSSMSWWQKFIIASAIFVVLFLESHTFSRKQILHNWEENYIYSRFLGIQATSQDISFTLKTKKIYVCIQTNAILGQYHRDEGFGYLDWKCNPNQFALDFLGNWIFSYLLEFSIGLSMFGFSSLDRDWRPFFVHFYFSKFL